jgi:hypothetical protein
MSTATKAAGTCECGAVKILVTLPFKGSVHCHCGGCRRVHGAAFVTWLSVNRKNLQISGREHLRWFESKPTARRGFCAHCGTHLLYLAEGWPDDVHVTRGCLLDKDNIPPPKAHIAFDQRVDWFSFSDSLPRFTSQTLSIHEQSASKNISHDSA